jgi:hypothetical protein
MFFDKRKKYNGDVAALLPAFAFTLEDAGIIKTLNVLDIAWQQNYTKYEAALLVAYSVFAGMLKSADSQAKDVLDHIQLVQSEWIAKELVSSQLVEVFSSRTNKLIAEHSQNKPVNQY